MSKRISVIFKIKIKLSLAGATYELLNQIVYVRRRLKFLLMSDIGLLCTWYNNHARGSYFSSTNDFVIEKTNLDISKN